MPLAKHGSMAHHTLERLAQGQARNRDIAQLIDRDSVFVRKLLHEMIGRGLAIMAKRRLGRGNPFAIYEITEIGRGELERLGAAPAVSKTIWKEAA